MLHFFDLPQIQDSLSFASSMKGGFSSQEASAFITKADQMRAAFKDVLDNSLSNLDRFPSLYTYEPNMNEYLKMQADIVHFALI